MSKKIMIVEDEPDVLDYLQTVLSTHGFETVTCMSASESFDLAEKERPDLVCLDIMMPEETGISFYTRLKQNEELKDIPVIIVTGITLEETREHAMELGAKGFLTKPLDLAVLIDMVNSLSGTNDS